MAGIIGGLMAISLLSIGSLLVAGDTLFPTNRSSFPDGFMFGAGSAAYQSEGGPLENGRGPCIWDAFIAATPEKVSDGSNANETNDFYHHYKWDRDPDRKTVALSDDIKLMKYMGLDSYRFSISWSRIFPKGNVNKGVNPIGVKFYNDLIDELVANDIKPFVTLLHFDNPQALEEEYGGPLNSTFVKDYANYADFCFKTYGDRVKYWATVNEPDIFILIGYALGVSAPGRCSSYAGNCTAGDSATEPYIVAHNLILSHGAAARLYKKKYQALQKGEIGITLAITNYKPLENTTEDKAAASRAFDFTAGWFLHPLIYGDYPKSMKLLVGSRLPNFTEKQSNELVKSLDFITYNYYFSNYVHAIPSQNGVNVSYTTDGLYSESSVDENGNPFGSTTTYAGFYSYPEGIEDVALYLKDNYKNPVLYVTENGAPDNASLPMSTLLQDDVRINYTTNHLSKLLSAIEKGANVKGYYAWNFMDDFEWTSGYTQRYGFVYVDYENNQTRYLKASAKWFKTFLSN